MRYLSICSGIEAATAAWHSLGWRPAAFAEIDRFPSAVLAHHYPDVPNLGDFTRIDADAIGPVDLLVGGTPCQSFSIAGLRGGLDDDRGNLALEFCRLARRARPRWVVWENVPGVLSLDGGRAFASILGGLADSGYGLAYRVLDAQFVRVDLFGRAMPQRRRRVFVVGYLGDWRRAAAVLFERQSLSWDSPPCREAGQAAARPLAGCSAGGSGYRNDSDTAENLVADSLTGRCGNPSRQAGSHGNYVAHTLNAKGGAGRSDSESESETFVPVAHALRADGFDASEDGTGRGTPLVPVCFAENSRAELRMVGGDGGVSAQLTTGGGKPGQGQPCIAFNARQDPDVFADHTGPLDTNGSTQGILSSWRVRRLTPTECERLQGFPDDFTAIPYRGKLAADGPRYKALGNSMAVNCMRWIGRRIEMVDAIDVKEVA